MKRHLAVYVPLLFASACSRDNAPGGPAAAPLPRESSPRETEIVVRVGAATLTRRQAEEETDFRFASLSEPVDPQRASEIRQRLFDSVVEHFIMRAVLLDEAQRLGIAVTAADEARAYARLEGSLKPGVSLDDVLRRGPDGTSAMRDEMLDAIRINKLLSAAIPEADLAVDEAEIDGFIERNRAELELPERAHARHILVAVQDGDSGQTRKARREAAEELRRRLLRGEDFGALARTHSDCPSRSKDGELGWFKRGQMPPQFDAAAFSLQIGETSRVLETPRGYHIVQVLDRRQEGSIDRDRVEQILSANKRQVAVRAFVAPLLEKADIERPVPEQR